MTSRTHRAFPRGARRRTSPLSPTSRSPHPPPPVDATPPARPTTGRHAPHVLRRAQDGAAQRRVLEGGGVQMVKDDLLGDALHLRGPAALRVSIEVTEERAGWTGSRLPGRPRPARCHTQQFPRCLQVLLQHRRTSCISRRMTSRSRSMARSSRLEFCGVDGVGWVGGWGGGGATARVVATWQGCAVESRQRVQRQQLCEAAAAVAAAAAAAPAAPAQQQQLHAGHVAHAPAGCQPGSPTPGAHPSQTPWRSSRSVRWRGAGCGGGGTDGGVALDTAAAR